jgi:ubiquinone/menaquinone biosynthesis C-methylase UbiE
MDQPQLTAHQFGATAANYLSSAVHAKGADLDRLAAVAARMRGPRVLDLGSGAGHASFALARRGGRRVVAYDLSPDMLAVVATEAIARGHLAIETVSGPAERLPFAQASFDLVVTRFSAHHWLDLPQALAEAARVVVAGGTLIVIDVLAPEAPLLDTALQTLELLRDGSHVRNYRGSEWRAMLAAAGFSAPKTDEPQIDHWKLSLEFQSWVSRIGTPAARVDALKVVFDALPSEARAYFAITADYGFSIDSAWIETTKPLSVPQ